MKEEIRVIIHYPKNMEKLERRAAEIMADILLKKLQPKEISNLIKVLQSDNNLTW